MQGDKGYGRKEQNNGNRSKDKNQTGQAVALKEQSDKIAFEIEELLKHKDALQKQELIDAIESSGRTYEEITEFLKSAPKRNAAGQKPKRKYTKIHEKG